MERSPTDPCFFILGYGRSGTTLFRRMLSAHPGLYVPPENDAFQRLPPVIGRQVSDQDGLDAVVAAFTPWYDRVFDREAFLREASARLPLSPAETITLLQGSALIGRDKPDAMWGHKSPSEWPYVYALRRWFPQARYLHVVRHPQDSTASMNEYQLQRYPTTPLVAAWQWRKAFRAIRRHGRTVGPGRYHLLRYEDLVAEPERVLAEACAFLGVSADPVSGMIDFRSDPSAQHVDEGEHMARTQTALTQDRVGREADYTDRQVAMVDFVIRDELRQLGYAPRADRTPSRAQGLAYESACAGLDAAWAAVRSTRRARGQL